MKVFLRLAVIVLLVAGWSAAMAQPREYAIPEIRVTAEIRSDGSVAVTETRRYDFDGAYTWANYRLPKRGFSRVRDIRVSEGERPFINENSERSGTFLVEESGEAINLRWFYTAENESRSFTVSYLLDDAVVIGTQWSEFFWNFLAAGREKPTARFSADILLPESVPPDSLLAWGRGAVDGMQLTRTDGRINVEAEDIGRNAFVAVRSVFPTAVFDPALTAVSDPSFSLDTALRQQQAFLQEQTRRAELAGTARGTVPLIVLLNVAGLFWFYRRYGARHDPRGMSGAPERLAIPDESLRPAAVGWLLAGRRATPGHLMATLLDLARRGYFSLRETPPVKGLFGAGKPGFTIASTGKEEDADLRDWEVSLLCFVRERLDGRERRLDKLLSEKAGKAHKWFAGWQKQLRADVLSLGWIDRDSYRGAAGNAVLQILLLAAAAACTVLAGPIAVPALVASSIAALLSLAIIRRTPAGEAVWLRWKGYSRALSQAGDERVRGDQLDRHFIFAVAFGKKEKHIARLFESSPETMTAAWIVLLSGSTHSPASLARTFNTLNATGTAAFGGATGAGGGAGASAGAAGGGASGGAG